MNTSIPMSAIFTILLIHWFADFVCQTHWQATNKGKSNHALFSHVFNYSSIFGGLLGIFLIFNGNFNLKSVVLFTLITFVFHFVTDYLTSRLNTYLWNKKDVHNFFVSVGGDQLFHYFQLIFTYWYLFL